MSTPVTAVSEAMTRHGYGPRPTGHGALYPATPERLRELAAAVRRRSKWRLAAALEELAAAVGCIAAALSLPPGHARMPALTQARTHENAATRFGGLRQ